MKGFKGKMEAKVEVQWIVRSKAMLETLNLVGRNARNALQVQMEGRQPTQTLTTQSIDDHVTNKTRDINNTHGTHKAPAHKAPQHRHP